MRTDLRRFALRYGSVVFCLLLISPALPAMAAGANPASASEAPFGADTWPAYNNTFDGRRFSPLAQINPGNAANLKEVCRVKISNGGSFQPGPVLVDGVMYVTIDSDTIALDPVNCRVHWRSVYKPEQPEVWHVNRGVAYLNGRLFRGTGDARLLALDARTGKVIWKDVVGDPRLGEYVGSAPIAWNGLVFAGTSGSDWGVRGRMMAFDALTGREVWRFNTIPIGDEKGADSWKSTEAARKGGGGTWTSYTVDVATGELFIPVGNPAPDFAPHYREGENLFTDAGVVLDAQSGALKWWYQLRPHDGHDLDLAAPPMLYTNSKGDPVLVLAGKDGRVHAVDRETHKLLFKTDVTTIRNEAVDPTPEGVVVCPGALGGVLWNGPTYDEARKTIYVGSVDWCSKLMSATPEYVTGHFYFGGSWKQTGPAGGWVTAIDSDTGAVRWRYRADAPVIAGVTATAGGVVFTGDSAGNFLVFDSGSGKLLRKAPTGGAMAGGVITYELSGKQYVAITSGNISRSTFGAVGSPTVIIMSLSGTKTMPEAHATAPAQDASAGTSSRAMAVLATGDADRGKALYAQTCAACHGANGETIPGYNLKTVKSRKDAGQIVAWLKDPPLPMPKLYPSPLSEKDLKDLAAFLENF